MAQIAPFTVVVPARMASTRLPGKMLLEIGGLPVIVRTARQALTSAATRVVVATDHADIANALANESCEVVMTSPTHQSGSDRLAEVVELLGLSDQEIVVNVQGDEPLIPPRLINETAAALANARANTPMATAARKITEGQAIQDPNVVKVVMNMHQEALYFSRAPIPFARDARVGDVWHHIGIYAYRAKFLREFSQLQPSTLELCESLEQLRVLDHGKAIQVHCFDYDSGFGIDTQHDLDRARAAILG